MNMAASVRGAGLAASSCPKATEDKPEDRHNGRRCTRSEIVSQGFAEGLVGVAAGFISVPQRAGFLAAVTLRSLVLSTERLWHLASS